MACFGKRSCTCVTHLGEEELQFHMASQGEKEGQMMEKYFVSTTLPMSFGSKYWSWQNSQHWGIIF